MPDNEEDVETPDLCPVCEETVEDCGQNVITCNHGIRGGTRYHHASECCVVCGQCFNRCECVSCEGCDNRWSSSDPNICDLCERCSECCGCPTCEACDERSSPRRFCTNCNSCASCGCSDECEGRTDGLAVGVYIRRPLKFWAPEEPRKGFKMNPVKRFTSLEIEVAAFDQGPTAWTKVQETAKRWSASTVKDGSLPHGGFEVNTSPAMGDPFLHQLMDWCDTFKSIGARINDACGVHVHVDARDIKVDDAMKVFHLYAKVEHVLFGLVAPSRQTSTFCKPVATKLMLLVDQYNEAGYAGHKKTSRLAKRNVLKTLYPNSESREYKVAMGDKWGGGNDVHYWAFNVHSWFHRGTFEFRHHHGTLMFHKLRNWALICAALVDKAQSMSWDQIHRMKYDALEGLTPLCPDETSKAWAIARWNHFHPERQITENGLHVNMYAEI